VLIRAAFIKGAGKPEMILKYSPGATVEKGLTESGSLEDSRHWQGKNDLI
jgi:hypothetical protein